QPLKYALLVGQNWRYVQLSLVLAATCGFGTEWRCVERSRTAETPSTQHTTIPNLINTKRDRGKSI
ncbi:hypothetical protein PSTG_19640, partial [Puccinia striiformis f. sp. tritici PST-78]